MRILTYKRTHPGDPDNRGIFGIGNCMGQVRDYAFDAVIGIGGITPEPRSYRIDGKITWVGIGARRRRGSYAASLVTFEEFLLVDANGPSVASIAPHLARRMYEGKVRFISKDYSPAEQLDAETILRWARSVMRGVSGTTVKTSGKMRVRCVCKKRKK